jgi:hypothetical protein
VQIVGRYLFAYRGSAVSMSPQEREASMAAWAAWFRSLGGAVLDMGAPFGASASVSQSSDGAAAGGLGGYSIVSADSLAAASELARGCPVLAGGGSVDVYEAIVGG